MNANVDGPIPAWATARFGADAPELRLAIQMALLDTEAAMLESHVAGRSRKKFTAGAARMTNQYERLAEHVTALGIEGTELIKPGGTFYELVLVHNTLLYPYQVESADGFEPGDKWPKKLSAVVRELFALGQTPGPRWVEEPFAGLEGPEELVLRRPLAQLAERDPRPGLVLVPYEMNLSGLQRAWWGQANLLDEAGNLHWVTETSMLTNGAGAALVSVPDQRAGNDFASGDLPEIPVSSRSVADRALDVQPQVENDATENAAEGDEN
ncbi:hypothetical protein [Streptomyces rimosus]|nr:hypothetical protein [Streptomyces rimosus]